MATQLKPPLLRRLRRALSTLFRDARRLERQRRLRYSVAASLLCVAAAGGGFLIASGGPVAKGSGGSSGGTGRIEKLALPRSGDYFNLTTVGDHLVVSGGPDGSPFPSGALTVSNGRVVGRCDSAIIPSGRLKLTSFKQGNCGDPALYGVNVLAVSYLESHPSRTNGIGEFAVRIARTDPGTQDGYALGPVVMTYPQCSDCDAQWIYGDGSLWLYDPDYKTSFQGGLRAVRGELLRVSEATGRVARRWVIPSNTRELLAVDADGLWFAPSVEGVTPANASASEKLRYESLYHVAPGAKAPQRVFTLGPWDAHWLVASGHTVWLETNGVEQRSKLLRFNGLSGRPTLLGEYPKGSDQGGDIGEGPATHAGNSAIGIDYVADPDVEGDTRQSIMSLSSTSAKQRTVGTVHAPVNDAVEFNQTAGVALGRSFYFLDAPSLDYPGGTSTPIVRGRGVLYRVTPQHPH